MDPRSDVREFLVSRRARISPEDAGLPAYGSNRRVNGLRREEVAMLAGISAEYYIRLERGNLRGVSEDVLDGIARALQLDEAERLHLRDLAHAANSAPGRAGGRRTSHDRVRPVVQRLLDSFVGVPAFVTNERLDVIAANRLGEAFYAPLFDDPVRPVNSARFVFLNPRAKDFFDDWQKIADDTVAVLRAQAGRDPYDKRLSDLIGELSTRSDDFRVRWARHDVKLHNSGTSTSATLSSATSPSTGTCLSSRPTPDRGCSRTPPSRDPAPTKAFNCLPAGRRHRHNRNLRDCDEPTQRRPSPGRRGGGCVCSSPRWTGGIVLSTAFDQQFLV
jgi:transcriptional regulator with XRE-family HTH domain